MCIGSVASSSIAIAARRARIEKDVSTTIYSYVLNRDGRGVVNPLDR